MKKIFLSVLLCLLANSAFACGFGSSISGGRCRGYVLAGTTTWSVPTDWNSANNLIEAIGEGGAGSTATSNSAGGGGGGGAYANTNNFSSASGTIINVQVGAGGTSTTSQ